MPLHLIAVLTAHVARGPNARFLSADEIARDIAGIVSAARAGSIAKLDELLTKHGARLVRRGSRLSVRFRTHATPIPLA